MKKLIIGSIAMLLIAGTTFAQDKTPKKEKSCCSKSTRACCKQPTKTAALRTKAVKTKG